MPWLKRNLVLVIGILVAVGLLGFAGYFLYTKMQVDQSVTEQLDQKTQELKRLVARDPHPGTDKLNNIAAAKDEARKLREFVSQVKEIFPAWRAETNQMSSQEFRELLDITIDKLRRDADRAGVKLPDDYWFTFAAQKSSMTFQTNVVGTLAAQLSDIEALCEILYDAKVVSLLGLRRMSVATDDSGQDFLTEKGKTNNWTISTPYEISFQGFSSEVATVLAGIVRSKNCLVVRNIAVDRADAPQTDESQTPSSEGFRYDYMRRYGPMMPGNPYNRYGIGGPGGGMSPEMRQRYGLGPPVAPQPTTPTRTITRGGMTVLLEEKALRVTLSVDSVKLKPPGMVVRAAPAAPAPVADAAAEPAAPVPQ